MGGTVPGDQVFGRSAVGPSGGYLVWHDNVMDGDGYGIGVRRLDRNFVGGLGVFRGNANAAGDQEYPQAALFGDGGAVLVWQGGPTGFPRIYARFMAADGTFATQDILVNTYRQGRQEQPQVAILKDGSAVVVWTSYGQDGSHDGVYGQRMNARGELIGPEFRLNQRTLLSQRSPSVRPLPNGKYVVVWVSEKENSLTPPGPGQEGVTASGPGRLPQPHDVSVFGRLFDGSEPASDEFKVNTSSYVCANPTVSVGDQGAFLVAWSSHVGRLEVGGSTSARGWDVRARAFAPDGRAASGEIELNERSYADQFLPSAACVGNDHLVSWISLGQDGSREGIFGRVVSNSGTARGPEFRVNTFTAGSQKMPSVSSDGAGHALVVWSRARGGLASYDLFAQRFATSEQMRAPEKPMVRALSASRLSVTWPSLAGLGAVSYELYVDESTTPVPIEANYWTVGQLPAGSVHTFRLGYVTEEGARSPLSEPASGTTWGEDGNFDGLPDDWQALVWGPDEAAWPSPDADTDDDGASNRQEFLAGTDPQDPQKVLRLVWRGDRTGASLGWNAEQGCIYQVQISTDLRRWENVGAPRFAAGESDSIPIGRTDRKAMYRVIRVR